VAFKILSVEIGVRAEIFVIDSKRKITFKMTKKYAATSYTLLNSS
jgi:hypothetical protein